MHQLWGQLCLGLILGGARIIRLQESQPHTIMVAVATRHRHHIHGWLVGHQFNGEYAEIV